MLSFSTMDNFGAELDPSVQAFSPCYLNVIVMASVFFQVFLQRLACSSSHHVLKVILNVVSETATFPSPRR